MTGDNKLQKMSTRPEGMRRAPWVQRNSDGDIMDLYGVRDVYEGAPAPRTVGARYLVWSGISSNSMTGRGTRKTLRSAMRLARKWQNAGHFVRISDRLVQDDADQD